MTKTRGPDPDLKLGRGAAAMAIGTIHGGQVPEVNRMFEGLIGNGRELLLTFSLRRQRVAGVAVFADDFS